GLMVRSFQELRALDPAFDAHSALSFRIGLPAREYPDQPQVVARQQAILERLSTLPGVTGVAASTCLPLAEEGNCFSIILRVEARVVPPGTIPPIVSFRSVTGGYFETIGTRLIRGRTIIRDDVDRKELVAIVNQALVNAYFANEDPIGQRVTLGPPRNRAWLTIVGVVPNTPVRALAEPTPVPQLYLPM